MRETTIGGVTRKIDINAMTTIVYERALKGHRLHEDVNDLMGGPVGTITMLPLDAALRLEYAAEHSVVSSLFPDYDAWLRAFPVEALDQDEAQRKGGWVSVLADEIVATFFRRVAKPAEDVGADAAEGPSAPAA